MREPLIQRLRREGVGRPHTTPATVLGSDAGSGATRSALQAAPGAPAPPGASAAPNVERQALAGLQVGVGIEPIPDNDVVHGYVEFARDTVQ